MCVCVCVCVCVKGGVRVGNPIEALGVAENISSPNNAASEAARKHTYFYTTFAFNTYCCKS